MKKVLLLLAPGLLFASCTTTRLISNSEGYDYKTNSNAQLKRQPDWIKTQKEEKLAEGVVFHFVGQYLATENDPDGGRIEAVRTKAVADARSQVSEYLISEIKTTVHDYVKETNVLEETEVNGTAQSARHTEAQDELYIESYFKSSSSFSGLIRLGEFYECHEATKTGKQYYKCWVHYSISRKDIEKAKADIERKESVSAKERRMFARLKKQCTDATRLLKNTDFLQNESDYKSFYFELCELNSTLKGLSYYHSLDLADDERREYNALLEKNAAILDEYDPTDIQKQTYLYVIRQQESALQEQSGEIERLKSEIDELKNDKDGIISALERKIALKEQEAEATQNFADTLTKRIAELQKSGIHLVSTNVFAVYPSKPEFTFSSDGVSFCAQAVTNREFISYLTLTGSPDYSRAEDGLDSPAIVSFLDSIRYCNWLSRLYGLPEFYTIEGETVRCNGNSGYRLPFEEELSAAQEQGFSFLSGDGEIIIFWGCAHSAKYSNGIAMLCHLDYRTAFFQETDDKDDALAGFFISRTLP